MKTKHTPGPVDFQITHEGDDITLRPQNAPAERWLRNTDLGHSNDDGSVTLVGGEFLEEALAAIEECEMTHWDEARARGEDK